MACRFSELGNSAVRSCLSWLFLLHTTKGVPTALFPLTALNFVVLLSSVIEGMFRMGLPEPVVRARSLRSEEGPKHDCLAPRDEAFVSFTLPLNVKVQSSCFPPKVM